MGGGAFRVLWQTPVEPRRETVPESCGSQNKGVPGGSKNSSAPVLPPAVCRWGAGEGGDAQVLPAAR